ncbi:hypothetical protein ACGFZB_35625 [Streptomyces cinerochromogenes]|uniref:Integral membrane protein n=1 Tax=Streptomyces cinerochromogenes TaxID=66422 RepID=A0ABW7BIV5_9ACTN
MVGRTVRRTIALGAGAVWWWAVLRLAVGEGPGVVEAAVVTGGWGVSLLPVHCVPKGRATGAVPTGRRPAAWRARDVTRASPRPRSGEVSDPS